MVGRERELAENGVEVKVHSQQGTTPAPGRLIIYVVAQKINAVASGAFSSFSSSAICVICRFQAVQAVDAMNSESCIGKFLGRFSFQPIKENPLLGPSSSTLEKMGALDVDKVVHRHQAWRLISCIWLHAGVFHLLANMLSLVFIGIRLEQEFGFIRIGLVYFISGFGGSLLSALFIQMGISVGASGALFGLLGGMLSELITNWTIYANKLAALLTLVLIIIINLAVGILPHVDNFAHIGGFLSGFLLGFVLLIRPQFGWVNQKACPPGYIAPPSKSRHKTYQYVLWVVSLILLIVGFTAGLLALLRGVDLNNYCSWCHYLSCVPTSLWSCKWQNFSCEVAKLPMDEIIGEDAFSGTPKTSNGNIEGEMEKEHKMEEVDNDEKEQFSKEFDMVIRGEEEKENMQIEMNNDNIDNVETEITLLEPVKMNGKESILIPVGKGKEELTKESNVVIGHDKEKEHTMEKLNNKENPNEEVAHVEDTKEEVKNEEQIEAISKKIDKLRKKGKKALKKKMALKGKNEVIVKDINDQKPLNKKNLQTMEELNNKANVDDELVQEEDEKEKVKDEDKVEDISQKKKGRKYSRKKLALKAINEVIVKDTNEQEPSNKNAKLMGMIFMCSSKTKKDCYRYKVLGLPVSKRDVVLQICEGMKLFLFDFDLKLLYGIYKATGPGGYNIEPKAFKSAFPSQVRFNVYEDCLPLPEEKFKKVIKDNYYQKNKFDCRLTSEQVKNLCKLFRAAGNTSELKGLQRNPGAKTRTFTDRDKSRKRHHVAEIHKFADQDRTRKRRLDTYEREIYASPVAPLPSCVPLPRAPTLVPPPQSYAYERILERNDYRMDPPVEHQDRLFRDLELRRREQIKHARDHDLSYSASQPSEYQPYTRTLHRPASPPHGIGLYDRYIGARSWRDDFDLLRISFLAPVGVACFLSVVNPMRKSSPFMHLKDILGVIPLAALFWLLDPNGSKRLRLPRSSAVQRSFRSPFAALKRTQALSADFGSGVLWWWCDDNSFLPINRERRWSYCGVSFPAW
ncbi:hypothetical protein GH714_035451 [Hevea brasiliensis]|uniref:RHOMBOID-like protein n=1 Tax=Hevea brasiliensis TaxID=3981 RepID=A0A6A6KRW0_HEVBR|nr:hypothetical protein GH714_035451 [Hevea brasiliensis]